MEPNRSDIDKESDFSEQAKNEDRNLLSKMCGCVEETFGKTSQTPPSSLPSWWASFKLTLTVKQFGPERLN